MPAKTASAIPKKPYKEVIIEALKDSKSRTGLSRQALKKYFSEKVPEYSNSHLNAAIKNGVTAGLFEQKSASAKVKLTAAAKKPAPKKVAKKPVAKKAPVKKAAAAAAPKKKAVTTTKKVVKKVTKKPAAKKVTKK
ncbi:hypothetical protein HANVADRAFT_51786 [Hanseniaspora valbyensis NRRL Y-1626]|uniref:Histone H1 n=1 Tax=Hanseniaspora valbyensis NRRL Y-1626 TaxID=766949 RepID=A0A1B7THF2_9ASCO|nr:hypothetical protein HANVADRAFT_51786 [Hanseniaspora valbyensis NRRL Y-1626]